VLKSTILRYGIETKHWNRITQWWIAKKEFVNKKTFVYRWHMKSISMMKMKQSMLKVKALVIDIKSIQLVETKKLVIHNQSLQSQQNRWN
jgi:hypothetical protein